MKKHILILLLSLMINSAFATGHYTLHRWTYGGLNREYFLYVPSSYDSAKPTAFVLVLHGLGDTISNFKGIGMNLVADTANFIFAMPQAVADTNYFGETAWNSGAGLTSPITVHLNPTVDDVGFLNAIIDSTASHYNIDSTRLYSTGFSMGGFMTNLMGCRLGDRLAAIASVSGTIGVFDTCTPTRVIPACHFHGTKDQFVAYTGNSFGNDPEALVAYWVANNHCDTVPVIDTLPGVAGDTLTFIHYTYPNGKSGSDVEFYKVVNGTHEWIIDEPTMNYSVAIWQFFSKFKWNAQVAVSGVQDVAKTIGVKVFPNPANDVLNVEYNSTDIELRAEFAITDLTGRTILSNELVANKSINQINLKGLNAGLYTYSVRTNEEGIVSRGIFVVTH